MMKSGFAKDGGQGLIFLKGVDSCGRIKTRGRI